MRRLPERLAFAETYSQPDPEHQNRRKIEEIGSTC